MKVASLGKRGIGLLLIIMAACSNLEYKRQGTAQSRAAATTNNVSVPGRCPSEMVFVDGDFCLKPNQKCLDWMEDPVKYSYARCRLYDSNITCDSKRVHMSFCIDRLEAAGEDGLPVPDISWTDSEAACEKAGKRLCKENEWTFACEGEQMLPYPYGLERDSTKCNIDIYDNLVTNEGKLADYRKPVTANTECVSPFGVINMTGNIDEWVLLDKPHFSQKNHNRKMWSGLKGGWWGPLRNRCRPTTVDHDQFFHELQTGYRCCKDI